jgi:C_GCAxxG_C_C family probable redox protein
VLLSVTEQLVEERSMLPRFASGFGGGIGRTGLVCGAISGAVMSAGSRYGTGAPCEDMDRLYKIASSLVNSFTKKFGSANCRELIEADLGDPTERKRALKEGIFADKCAEFVEFCANEVASELSG